MQPTASELLALRARETTYPGAAEHISTVRADLRPLLHDCPVADEVILCASELAANAALHSNSRLPGGTFTVLIIVSRGDFVRIEVHDNGSPWTRASGDSTGHHGLDIVRALADKWGTDGNHTRRTTWAIFTWPHSS
jgi:anti-sigma regulatory factor (Ser/Thr protein kinase)